MKIMILSLFVLGAISTKASTSETRVVEKSRIIDSKLLEISGCDVYYNENNKRDTYPNTILEIDDSKKDEVRLTGERFDYSKSSGAFILSVPMTLKKKVIVQNYLVKEKTRKNGVVSEKIIEDSFSEPIEKTIVETLLLTEEVVWTPIELLETPEKMRIDARARLHNSKCQPLKNEV